MDFMEKLKIWKRKTEKEGEGPPLLWFETSVSVCRRFQFEPNSQLSVKLVGDSRPLYHKIVESFLNKFFPSGYPYSVNEGYLRYTQFRALQHIASAALSVLSTQSLLFAAGLRPTPAQATAVSWILKDGMEHVGKLICSNLGARMDSEPKRWRILADVLYDLGTGLEVFSPLCPQLFLQMAGLGNFAKGMAVVAARATRLPIYSSFAKEGNLSDLFAKGEAISTLFNVVGIGVGIQLASTICTSMQGKTGNVSSPADLRYQEDLLFPQRLVKDAGNVRVGRALHKVIKPSRFVELKQVLPGEKFLLNGENGCIDMVLEHDAIGEDALKGWLVAAYAVQIKKSSPEISTSALVKAYEKMNEVFPVFLKELQSKGWHTDRFLDGTGSRFAL
ncbi:protein root UVB sensitive 2, chloroplastic-like isoform X3 [Abrus precatorius]|uniref:Protein root UVB sensitive 2, chloroplastic-like isoform X3 n=1 Tax=Abrus precatorius TaxID=3816 RepID=A0A8B8MA54_ABRPR|nr:protein root UVB sensitive 2, chloroplastic-like isoform X3 [Abrus precatorius]